MSRAKESSSFTWNARLNSIWTTESFPIKGKESVALIEPSNFVSDSARISGEFGLRKDLQPKN